MSELSYLEKLLDGAEVEWVSLANVCRFINGRAYKQDELLSQGKYPVLRVGNFFSNQNWYYSNFELEQDKYCDNGDLLYAWSASFGPKIWQDGKVIYHYHIWKVIPNLNIITKEFLYYLLAWDTEALKKSCSTGSTMLHISKAAIEKRLVPIPCPSNPEKSLAIQSEIVRVLDKFTALTAELTAELTARKKQYNYYRDQLLSFEEGDVEWKTLGEIGTWHGGGTPSKSRSEFWENGSIPWISPKDMGRPIVDTSEDYITEEAVQQSSTKLVPANSIAIVVRSSILDKVMPSALIPVPATFNQDMKVVIPHCNISPNYIAHIMRSRGGDILRAAKKSGGSVASIDSKKLFSFRIPVPHLNEQKRIVNILDKFDTLANSITEGLPREIELRQKQYEYYRDLLFSFPKPDYVTN